MIAGGTDQKMVEFSYKNCKIRILPYEPTPQHWTAGIRIFLFTGRITTEQELFLPEGRFFKTREQVEKYAFGLAKNWIDSN